MRIGLTGFGLGRGQTGIATYVFNLWKALGQMDPVNIYDVMIPKQARTWLPPLPSNFHLFPSASFIEQPLLNILWHHSVLPIRAHSRRYQLIHIPTIRRIPLIKSCPIVSTVHDMAGLAVENKYDSLRLLYHRHFLTRCIHRCDKILTVSHATKRDIVHYTGFPERKIEVIYSGIDHNTFRPLDPLEAMAYLKTTYHLSKPFIVYVSRIEHPGKNHVRLIQAFESLRQQHATPYDLVFAGADWHGAQTVKTRAFQSPYRDSIHFLGFVPTEAIVNLYSASELMAFPSLYEGFGFPLLEAMACNALTACSNSSSLFELAQGYGEMFNPLDKDAICFALQRALTDPNKEERRAKARAYAHSFNWANTAQQVLTIYQQYG